jgi:hypothetical protein
MRIVVTNEHLDQRPGSELYVRDLARGLQKLGHFVIAYSSDPRHQVRLLERDLIAVATDLTRLPFRPDVIHARHHLDAMTALVALPGVPAVFDYLGDGGLGTVVPVHPRLHRYVVPRGPDADRIAALGVAGDRIEVGDFGVDLARFSKVRAPAAQGASRAAVYDGRLCPTSPIVVAIKEAVLGGELDLIGPAFGRSPDNPESRLPGYHVVFSRGSRAVEAMACGCAVVIVDEHACAGLVTAASFQAMRAMGFSPSGDEPPATAAAIRASIDLATAPDTAAVTAEVRRTLGLGRHVDRLVAAYSAAIAANDHVDSSWAVEQESVSRYLGELARAIKWLDTEQKRVGDVPLGTASTFLDVAAGLSAIEADLDRAHWWPEQRTRQGRATSA